MALEELNKYKNVPVEVAAEILGIGQQHVRVALQQKTLPIGSATKLSEKRWCYHISPGLLKEYVLGSIGLREYFEKNKEILKEILEEKEEKGI